MRKDYKELIRPTIRINKKWYEELKVAIDKQGTTFQELTTKLLEDWYEQKKTT